MSICRHPTYTLDDLQFRDAHAEYVGVLLGLLDLHCHLWSLTMELEGTEMNAAKMLVVVSSRLTWKFPAEAVSE